MATATTTDGAHDRPTDGVMARIDAVIRAIRPGVRPECLPRPEPWVVAVAVKDHDNDYGGAYADDHVNIDVNVELE
jgi:hypothetical protein